MFPALILAVAPLAISGAGRAAAETVQTDLRAGVVQVVAPVSVPARASHWTLRAPVALAQSNASEDAQLRMRRSPHAQVAMFSWREILFYAFGAVLIVAGLLALVGSHRRASRHY